MGENVNREKLKTEDFTSAFERFVRYVTGQAKKVIITDTFWAYEAISWCSMNKVVQGMDDNCFNPKAIYGELTAFSDDDDFEWYKKQIDYCKNFDKCIQKSKTYVDSKDDLYYILIQHPDSDHLTDFWELGKIVGYAEEYGDDKCPVYCFNSNVIDFDSFPWEDMTRDCFGIRSDDASSGLIVFNDANFEKTHPYLYYYTCDFD